MVECDDLELQLKSPKDVGLACWGFLDEEDVESAVYWLGDLEQLEVLAYSVLLVENYADSVVLLDLIDSGTGLVEDS